MSGTHLVFLNWKSPNPTFLSFLRENRYFGKEAVRTPNLTLQF